MAERRGCAEVRALLPELAAGVAAGDERARALRHLGGCDDCRRALAALATTADELLTLAPAMEPPAGFESRVLSRVARPARRWPRRALRLAVTATLAVAVGLVLGNAVTMRATAEERRVAASCRKTQDAGTLTGHRLNTPDASTAGKVFTYGSRPAWVFVMVRFGAPGAAYEVRMVMRDGAQVVLGQVAVADGAGSWSGPVGVEADRIAEIRLSATGAEPLTAVFP
jgi:hypothetical protein